MDLGFKRVEFCHCQSTTAALVRCAPGGTTRIVYERKGRTRFCQGLGCPDYLDALCRLLCIRHSSNPYAAPAIILNPLLDALEQALAPSMATGIQNLGLPEMVQHAYIAGKIETDEGVLGDQAIAIVPVEIVCI